MGDFIFREADEELRFVGDFNGLYQAEDDPWGQSGGKSDKEHYYFVQRTNLANLIYRHSRFGRVLEVGCGLGHSTNILRRLSGSDIDGLDISEVAVEKARKKYPHYEFFVGDIREAPPQGMGFGYSVVVLNQVLWYILEGLESALWNSLALMKPDGLFVVSQAFLPGTQRYGVDILDGFDGLLKRVEMHCPNLRIVEASYSEANRFGDGLVAWRIKE